MIHSAVENPEAPDQLTMRERRLFRGETRAFLGDHSGADDDYAAVLESGESDAVAVKCHLLVCALRIAQGRERNARAELAAAERIAETLQVDDAVALDVRFNHALLLEREGRHTEAVAVASELRGAYDNDTPAGIRGRAYCDLISARVALARHRNDEAASIATAIAQSARGESALIRVVPQALHLLGQARLAEARFGEAGKAFRECMKKCDVHPGSRPTLRRVRAEAQIALAATTRARGRPADSIPVLRGVRDSLRSLDDNEDMAARCLLSLAISHVALATTADDDVVSRLSLASARSALQEARAFCAVLERGEALEVRVLTLLAHVQRALGRRRQARVSLDRVGQLVDNDSVPDIDRADYLAGRAIEQLSRADQPVDVIDAAERYLLLAREQYSKAGSWYELARTDQNLALVDVRRADLATDSKEQRGHLEAAVDKLVPALLAKFAVRFTFMSTELRRSWTAGQQRAFELLLSIGERLGDEQLIADLVLTSRIHGVLTPTPGTAFDPPPTDEQRPPDHLVEASTSATTGPVADLLGTSGQPSLLAPAPMLIAPNDHRVFGDHMANAIARYDLPADRLYTKGAIAI